EGNRHNRVVATAAPSRFEQALRAVALGVANFFCPRIRPFFLLLRFLSIMRKNSRRESGTLNHGTLVAFGLCAVGVFLAVLGFGATPRGTGQSNAVNSSASLTGASGGTIQPFAGGGVGD